MKLLHTLTLTLFTLSVSGQTVLPNPSTVTAATINAALTGHITSSTAANDYTGLLTGWTSYPGAFDIRFTNHNTGSATFNLNSIGAKTLKKYSSGSLVDLVSGDISDGEVIRFQYDGTYLIKMGGGSVDVPGSDTQIIRNVSGALGASSALYYDATNNIFNASSNLTKVGSGSRSNNFYLGIDHTDSVASSTSNGWNFLQGEHETVSNNGSSGSVINNSFFYGGYRNAIRVKSGSASTIYNSGIIGGQDNYISASNSFLGSSVIIGGIKNRITATGVTRKGIAIIGGEKNIVTGNHSVAIGGYSQSVTDSATVAVPNLNITTIPITADTTTFVLGRRNSDGKVIKIHASALGGGGSGSSAYTNLQPNTQSSNYTLVITDSLKLVRMNSASSNNLTIPPHSSVAYRVGQLISIEQVNTGLTTIVAGGGVTINPPAGGTLASPGQGVVMVAYQSSVDTWDLFNGLPGFTNPMTTSGDIIKSGSSGTPLRLGIGSTGDVLTVSGGAPVWSPPAASGWAVTGATALTGNTSQTGSFSNTFSLDGVNITQNALTGTNKTALKITPGTSTALTASTEFNNFSVESATQQIATGTLTLQRFVHFKAPTISAVGASTITSAYNVYIQSPIAGTNATISNNFALGVNGNANIVGTCYFAAGTSQIDGTGVATNNLRRLDNTLTITGDNTQSNSILFNTANSYSQTTGAFIQAKYSTSTAHTSGNSDVNTVGIAGTINSTGNTGTYRGVSVFPTLTAWGGDVMGYVYNPTVTSISGVNYAWVSTSGKFSLPSVLTTTGTTGNQTINAMTGTVNIAAGGTTVTVTNNLCTVSSLPVPFMMTNDVTAKSCSVVPGAGSFVITLNAASTAEVKIGFIIYN